VAGYSGTPLPRKLGLKPEQRVLLVRPADGFSDLLQRQDLDPTVRLITRATGAPFDHILLFCRRRADLERGFADAVARITTSGGIWVCWPKKASGLMVDLDENGVRDHGLTSGLVDVKVCAIDEVWSGLRFVRRLTDR
jgi:hypothetical protein